jgi:hypothetical protein
VRRVVLATVVLLAISPAASATGTGGACPSAPHYDWMGTDVEQAVSITTPDGTDAGEVFRPAAKTTYPGRRPGIMIMHGLGGSQCDVWWAARDFAGHGYSVLTFTTTQFEPATYYRDAQSALQFLAGPDNPYAAYTDPSRLGAAGHSQGAIIAAMLQADPANHVSAIVGFDNLHKYETNDPGGAALCGPTLSESQPMTPRAPALGEAEDTACVTAPQDTDPAVKETGWSWWRSAHIPAIVVDIAGTQHLDWADPDGEVDPNLIHLFAYYAQAWFDRWLLHEPGAQARLLAPTVLGKPFAQLLSTHYLSGAYLPGVIDTDDLAHATLPPPSVASTPVIKQRVSVIVGDIHHSRRGVRVVLHTSRDSLKDVMIELQGASHVVRVRLATLSTNARTILLRPARGHLGAGRYTLTVRVGSRTLARRILRLR